MEELLVVTPSHHTQMFEELLEILRVADGTLSFGTETARTTPTGQCHTP